MINRGEGYTILEVLIFVAISGFLLIAGLTAINGRQQQVQFSQSAREFEANIKDIMNDIAVGYYPNEFEATVCEFDDMLDIPVITFENNRTYELGTSEECIFAGKLIHFFPTDADSGSNQTAEPNSRFDIYTLMGRREISDNRRVESIDEARPVVISNRTASIGNIDDNVETREARFGVEVTKVFANIGGSQQHYNFISVTPNFSGSNSVAASNNSQTVVVGAVYDDITYSENTQMSDVRVANFVLNQSGNPANGDTITDLPEGIVICLEDDDGRKASITIGDLVSQGTTLQFDDYNRGCDA